jgi:hypothetical protein
MNTPTFRFGDVATTRELIDACASRGVDVTVTRLARWVKYGLMDPARKRGMGPGKGSVQVWPADSLDRALFIAHALQEGDRSLESAARALIADGQRIRPELLREMLADVVRDAEESLQRWGEDDASDLQQAVVAASPMLARIDARSPAAAVDLSFLDGLTLDSFRRSVAALDDAQLFAALDDASGALNAFTATFKAVLVPLGAMFAATLFAQQERYHKPLSIGHVNVESFKTAMLPVELKARVCLLLTLWFARSRVVGSLPPVISR